MGDIFATGDWDEYERELNAFLSLPGLTIGVGVPDEPHSGKRAVDLTLDDLVEINEYGSGNIPARPVFGPSMDAHGDGYVDAIGRAVGRSMKRGGGRIGLTTQLEAVAQDMKRDVQAEIKKNKIPNAPSTVREKGHDLAWVETGEVFESIEGVVQIEATLESVGSRGHRYRGDKGQFTKIGL